LAFKSTRPADECRDEMRGRELVVVGPAVGRGVKDRRDREVEHNAVVPSVATKLLGVIVQQKVGALHPREDMVQGHSWWLVRSRVGTHLLRRTKAKEN